MSLRGLLLLAMSYLLVLALVAFGVPLVLSLRQRVDSEVRSQARSTTDVAAISAAALLVEPDHAALFALAGRSAAVVRGRVIVVDRQGAVLADSAGDDTRRADYSSRPEITAALRGRRVQAERYSRTLGEAILVTSAPVVAGGRVRGAVRVTQVVGAVERAVRRNVAGLVLGAVLVLLFGLAVAALLARRLSRPMRELEAAAARGAGGDLSARVTPTGSSEQRALARAFNTMTERVERAIEAQEAFVADASHHLRTPLTGLRLRLEALAGMESDARWQAHVEAATRELDRLSHTVDELLILSATGEPDAPGQPVALATAARSAVARWEPAAAASDQELVLAERRPGATAWASPGDVQRALDALIENAVHYSPARSTITVVVDFDAVEVVDQGPGLSAERPDELFDRFHRGSAGKSGPPGTGLGLAIARELARRWGGEATLADGDGRGARARLWLPHLSNSLPGGD